MIARYTRTALQFVILSTAACGFGTLWAAGGAHEHGAAELFLSSEGKEVAITFNLPAHSVVGFETTAVSDEQKATVEQAQNILKVPDELFVLEGNTCEVTDVVIDVSSVVDVGKSESQPGQHVDYAEGHADHNDESTQVAYPHDHEHHGHDDGNDAPATDSHSDLSAAYAFKCDSNEALTQISFSPKGLPFGLERIDVFWVADWGQGAGQATRKIPQVTLRN